MNPRPPISTSTDRRAGKVARRAADLDSMRLMALVEAQRFGDVERAARAMLARNDRHPLALKALSFALVGLRRFEDVLPVANFAIANQSGDGELYNNRAIALAELMRWDEALPDFAAAVQLLPRDAEIHKNYGVALYRLHRWNDAVPLLLKAIELHEGDYLDAISILHQALFLARRLDEAYVVAKTLSQEFPDKPGPLHSLLTIEYFRSDWDEIDANTVRLKQLLVDSPLSSNPWGFYKYQGFGMPDFRRLAVDFAESMIPVTLRHLPRLPLTDWCSGGRPLRVGYMSSDFLEHPVTFVISELIERHDRNRVNVVGYSLRADDGSEERRRIQAAFDEFVDLQGLGIKAIAERIRADKIDVLVDLNGWTGYQRTEALALRPAPVQVSWLGHAGTLGMDCLADYVIGDWEVTPEGHEEWYVERIARMPHSFMPVDTRHPVSEVPTRESQNLPDDAFVLCSFNNSYKYNPAVFDLWCEMMQEMPDAVLWLLRTGESIMNNLWKEAEKRGIARSRVIFASRVPSRADYLARLQLADLALDPFPYNSHSTGADALLSGVPLVAFRGDTFPGRVGASLLRAAGLSELIADDKAEYVNIGRRLYRDRGKLAALKTYLADARALSPLFDMARFARDLEDLYFAMVSEIAQFKEESGSSQKAPEQAS